MYTRSHCLSDFKTAQAIYVVYNNIILIIILILICDGMRWHATAFLSQIAEDRLDRNRKQPL